MVAARSRDDRWLADGRAYLVDARFILDVKSGFK